MVTVAKEDDEDLEMQVFNPVQTISGMDDR
jgi:hypothetical protein